jgi:hypothetical protein
LLDLAVEEESGENFIGDFIFNDKVLSTHFVFNQSTQFKFKFKFKFKVDIDIEFLSFLVVAVVVLFFFQNGEDEDFACLSPEQIIHEQNRQIKEVAEILNISEATAGHYLRHYRWKKEVLLTKFTSPLSFSLSLSLSLLVDGRMS